MRYYILDTKKESDECRKYCLQAILSRSDNNNYIERTTQWSDEQIRQTDGKYVVPVCVQLGTFGYNVDEYASDWFPSDDIEEITE